MVVISDTGEWTAVTATSETPTPVPAREASGDVDLEIELSELDLGEEIDVGFSSAEVPSPMLSSMTLGEAPEGFAAFSGSLKGKTRLLIKSILGSQRAAGPDENQVFLLLGASPTFATLASQLDGKISEERLRRVLFDLLNKQLLELRD